MDARPLTLAADRVRVVLAALAVVAMVLATVPRMLEFADARALALASDVLPWIAVLVVWQVLVRRTARSTAALSVLPSDVFRAAIVWGGAVLLLSHLGLVALPSIGRRPALVLLMTTVEDVLYAMGILALGALAAFALTRTVIRPALRDHPAPVSPRDVSMRARFLAIGAGASFATAGVLLDVLVDFERTSDAALIGYLFVAAGLVAFASLVAWLVGDDVAFREQAAAAATAERDRIARELHDGVAKSVSILALEAATAASRLPEEMRPELLRIQRLARLLSEEMRAILNDVRAQTDPRPFGETLRTVAERHAPAELFVEGDLERIGTLARFEVLRIVDEGLTNAVRHAGARRIRARVAASGDRVRVEVEDDGAGVGDVDWNALPRSGRYGLIGIRERAELLRGQATLERGPLGGTMVRVDFPLPKS